MSDGVTEDRVTENRLPDDAKRPTVEHLRALAAFADAGSVAGAAAKLHTIQPTMSRLLRIWQRPNACGAAVLEREGRRLHLTERGRVLVPAVRDLVRQHDQLVGFVTARVAQPQTVRLAIGNFAAEFYLAPALAQLRRAGAAVQVETVTVRGRERVLGTADGRFDLAIVTHDPLQIKTLAVGKGSSAEPLHVEVLARQPYCVIAGTGTAAAHDVGSVAVGRAASVEFLARHELVGLDRQSGIRLRLERDLRGKKLAARFAREAGAGGWSAAREYARQRLGVAIVPLATLRPDDRKDLVIRRLPEHLAIVDYLIHRRGDPNGGQREVKAALLRAARAHEKDVRSRWKGLV